MASRPSSTSRGRSRSRMGGHPTGDPEEEFRGPRRREASLTAVLSVVIGALCLAAILAWVFLFGGLTTRTTVVPAAPNPAPAASPAAVPAADAGTAPGAKSARPAFDAALTWKHLEKQVDFGPRVPNTEGHRACRDYLMETLKPLADRVERQDLTEQVGSRRLEMSNIIARWKGKSDGNGVLLCAHWDTRPTADEERSPADRRKPILGANDGASGVAVLLELARHFKQQPPPVPVMIVLFDGEDYGPDIDRMFLGSRYFAAHLPADVPKRGILLDMVGDRDLVIPKEGYSAQQAPEVVAEVYAIAKRLGFERQFPDRLGAPIMDDHLPLLGKGLRVIDLIDFDYGPGHSWWHTKEDTPDKCSPASLKAVGSVVGEWVYTR